MTTKSKINKKSNLKVMIVLDVLPDRNGAGSYYRDLVEHITPLVKNLILFGPSKNNDINTLFTVPMPGDNTQKLYIPKYYHLSKYIEDFKPNIIILPTPGFYGLTALKKAKEINIPICPVLHNDYEGLASFYWGGFIGFIINKIFVWLNRLFFKTAKITLIMNEEMNELARKMGAKKIVSIGTPLAKEFLDKPLKPINNKIRRVLFAGRLAPEKRIDKVLESAKNLPNIKFAFAGDGPLKELVVKKEKELNNIKYLGWLKRRELIKELDDSEILVLPSSLETFGTAAFEGMSRGRIVIVSPEAGITNWSDLSSYLFKTSTEKTLTNTLEEIISLPNSKIKKISTDSSKIARKLTKETINEWIKTINKISKIN